VTVHFIDSHSTPRHIRGMARLARVVVPGLPHHVTQRGNGGARTFFRDEDYAFYRDLLARYANEAGVEVWAWVLMPNHVHLILNPVESRKGAVA
jgi:REP-associated tyrosine transposase